MDRLGNRATESGQRPRSIVAAMLPLVLVVAAVACTVFLYLSATSIGRTAAWAVPGAVYLVAAAVLLTPRAARKPVRLALAGVLVLAAVGIGVAFWVLFPGNPGVLVFGCIFLVAGVFVGLFGG